MARGPSLWRGAEHCDPSPYGLRETGRGRSPLPPIPPAARDPGRREIPRSLPLDCASSRAAGRLEPMNLTPELVADILVRQGYVTREQGETIRQEAKLVPHRLRSSAAYEQKALAYDLVMRLHLPHAKDTGTSVGEQEIAQAIAADAGLIHQRIDSLSLNADL